MATAHRVVATLRILLALAFAASLLAQVVVVPAVWARVAERTPELAYLRWPTLVVAVLELVCVEVVIVCTWRLLALVRRDRIFDEGAFAWVDAIVGAVAVGWVLMLATFGYVAATWDGPGLVAALGVVLLAGAVLGLLVVVMRALLVQATTLRSDLEGVI
ncbi:DUF2975 domain-containing protein [Euzebya sp.]|uniref:DUF2975 domain-containing protein n=1 Tax=Euzebya sp. TaxID=1971409 RepID=UPI003511F61A